MKGVVKIKNMRVYAFHGCLKEESKIGGDYRRPRGIPSPLYPINRPQV